MSICWPAKSVRRGTRVLAAAMLLAVCLNAEAVMRDQSPEENGTAAAVALLVARNLADMGDQCRDAGEIVRAYFLYSEAAKRDARKAEYREKRDAVATVARMLLHTGLDKANIKREIAQAEHDAAHQLVNARLESEEEQLPKLKTRPGATPDAASSLPLPQIALSFIGGNTPNIPWGLPQAPAPAAPGPNTPPPATEGPDSDKPPAKVETSNPVEFNYKAQVLAYGTYSDVRGTSVFNPNNTLAAIPRVDSHLAVRPDVSLKYSIFSLSAKPRLDYDQPAQGNGSYATAYMQEWEARLQPFSSLTLSYGREVLLWGPSMSVPASNPFFTDNGRNTPLVEVGGRDFARLIWQPSVHWSVSYIANTRLGRGTTNDLPFRQTGALKMDFSGSSLFGSLIYSNAVSQPFGAGKFIGGYVQKTIGQAIRVYVEGSAQDGTPVLTATPAQNPLGWQWTQPQLAGAMKPRTIVSGAAYTDKSGGTWTGEYIYNPAGYDSIFAANYYAMAQNLSANFLQGSALTPLAAAELAEAREPGGGLLLRRNYAFGQYQRNGLFQHLDVVLRYTISASDRSGQSVAYFTWDAGDHLQLFALFAGMNGSMDTEFARYLHYQAQIGLRFFIH